MPYCASVRCPSSLSPCPGLWTWCVPLRPGAQRCLLLWIRPALPHLLAKTNQPALQGVSHLRSPLLTIPAVSCPGSVRHSRPFSPGSCRVISTACGHTPAGAPPTLPCRKPSGPAAPLVSADCPPTDTSCSQSLSQPPLPSRLWPRAPASLAPTQHRSLSATALSQESRSWGQGRAAQRHPVRPRFPARHLTMYKNTAFHCPCWELLCRAHLGSWDFPQH